ncbi:MAG: phosphoglucosamine mutase [Bacteroidia bacterium]|nr:phosphoglucosamine mutase [Bacteroidia bacterium]MDW8158833.1 phosphoglucosamine mutase [Bacteroidia bacterium]
MTLIASISGIRGTVGGIPGSNLTPFEVVQYTAAYGYWLKVNYPRIDRVIVGRDSRVSGPIIGMLVEATLQAMGLDVVDVGINATPTVEVIVSATPYSGGIIISASHNSEEWNALKFLNIRGECLSKQEADELFALRATSQFEFSTFERIGKHLFQWNQVSAGYHVQQIVALPVIDKQAIQGAGLKICVDCVNGAGGVILPLLFKELGIADYELMNAEPCGNFAHNPEPLAENLIDLCNAVSKGGYDVGFALDPDADRLAIVAEDGSYFGEEYTIVAIADYLFDCGISPIAVSNLSSSRALAKIVELRGGKYFSAAVGEANVIQKMKEVGATIGGEGNGGVIYPPLHYGRDGILAIALFLSGLARKGIKPSVWRKSLPTFEMYKTKVPIPETVGPDVIQEWWQKTIQRYKDRAQINTEDGLKLDFADSWVHLRLSNTEPILRIYAEATTRQEAEALAQEFVGHIQSFLGPLKIA